MELHQGVGQARWPRPRLEDLAAEGIEVEVIDLRSLCPYDFAMIQESVRRTNRVLVAAVYLGLVAVLVVGMDVSYVARTIS